MKTRWLAWASCIMLLTMLILGSAPALAISLSDLEDKGSVAVPSTDEIFASYGTDLGVVELEGYITGQAYRYYDVEPIMVRLYMAEMIKAGFEKQNTSDEGVTLHEKDGVRVLFIYYRGSTQVVIIYEEGVAFAPQSVDFAAQGMEPFPFRGESAAQSQDAAQEDIQYSHESFVLEEDLVVRSGFGAVNYLLYPGGEYESYEALLPDLAAWSSGAMQRIGLQQVTDAQTNQTLNCLSYKGASFDAGLLADYVRALAAYDLNVTRDFSKTYESDAAAFYDATFDYVGSCSVAHGARKTELTNKAVCDVNLTATVGSPYGCVVKLYYPLEMAVLDIGKRRSGDDVAWDELTAPYCVTSAASWKRKNGYDVFTIEGFNQVAGDTLCIQLREGAYPQGSALKLEDFRAQADSGDAAQCRFEIRSKEITGDAEWGQLVGLQPNQANADRFYSLELEIVKLSNELAVLYFGTILKNEYGDHYLIEGLVATTAPQSEEAGAYASEDVSALGVDHGMPTPSVCTICNGSGICKVCFGRGGMSYTTYGQGGSGWVDCAGCKGSRKCQYCGGTGKYTQ